MRHGSSRRHPSTNLILRQQPRPLLPQEASTVAHSQGIQLPDTTTNDLIDLIQTLPPDNTTSLQVDFAHQRRVELDYTAGAVLRRAQESAVPTPTLQTLYLTLKSRAQSFGGL